MCCIPRRVWRWWYRSCPRRLCEMWRRWNDRLPFWPCVSLMVIQTPKSRYDHLLHSYTIGKRLETRAQNALIQLHGVFLFTPNITYWANNSFAVPLQNQVRSRVNFHTYKSKLAQESFLTMYSSPRGISLRTTRLWKAAVLDRVGSTGMARCGIHGPKVAQTLPDAPCP